MKKSFAKFLSRVPKSQVKNQKVSVLQELSKNFYTHFFISDLAFWNSRSKFRRKFFHFLGELPGDWQQGLSEGVIIFWGLSRDFESENWLGLEAKCDSFSSKCRMYTLLFSAKCKTECISQVADVLYILILVGTPAIANLALQYLTWLNLRLMIIFHSLNQSSEF
jgi:hypothetical protein